jgi:hypothetical protein
LFTSFIVSLLWPTIFSCSVFSWPTFFASILTTSTLLWKHQWRRWWTWKLLELSMSAIFTYTIISNIRSWISWVQRRWARRTVSAVYWSSAYSCKSNLGSCSQRERF